MSANIRVSQLIVLLFVTPFLETRHYHYHTKYSANHGDHTCFYQYSNVFHGRANYLVPYCIRTSGPLKLHTSSLCYDTNVTFTELQRKNITAEQLLKWFAPIDSISDYGAFLASGLGENELFCNCSQLGYSFGTQCQYQFASETTSFDALVSATFAGKNIRRDIRNLTEENDVTCYIIPTCTTYTGFCLDWRQVCDNRRDCVNGRDEEWCVEKELSECDEKTEYRCRSGHCIPRTFAFDLTIDCSEWDDEQISFLPLSAHQCSTSDLAECEEYGCGISSFSCGDGECYREQSRTETPEQCHSKRDLLLLQRVYAFQTGSSMECWRNMICQIGLSCLFESPTVSSLACQENARGIAQFCYELDRTTASCGEDNYMFFPTPSIAYPFVRLRYVKTSFVFDKNRLGQVLKPDRVCYNTSVCNTLTWDADYSPVVERGYHCYGSIDKGITYGSLDSGGADEATTILLNLQKLFAHCFHSPPFHSNLFPCPNGPLISHYRVTDAFDDCHLSSADEHTKSVSYTSNLTDRVKCADSFIVSGSSYKYIPKRLLRDGIPDCQDMSDELFPVGCTDEYDCQFLRDLDTSKSYPVVYEDLCNGFYLRFSQPSNENLIDETDCDLWPCKTRMHRCDSVWNRPNGCDELDCHGTVSTYLSQIVANCSIDEHYCLQFNQSTLTCLPFTRAGDGIIDCLFALDEQRTHSISNVFVRFAIGDAGNPIVRIGNRGRCWNTTQSRLDNDQLCDRKPVCPLKDDEQLCAWHLNSACSADQFTCKNGTCLSKVKRCNERIDCWPEGEDEWACEMAKSRQLGMYRPFTLTGFDTEPHDAQAKLLAVTRRDAAPKLKAPIINDAYAAFHCHRGILLRSKEGSDACICPPSYHGSRCQFQSERLAITFRTEMPPVFDQNTIYHLVFLLLDQHYSVLTLETIVHTPGKESTFKHFIHLRYPRHGSQLTNDGGFVQIEAYPVTTTGVGALSLAWRYSVQFPFLPVNRLALKLDLATQPLNKTLCRELGCVHGLCTSYVNTRNEHFCSCEQAWAGFACSDRLPVDRCVQLKCDSSYSKCIVRGDVAVCLCTLGRIGHNCRIAYDACDALVCEHGGKCVTLDERTRKAACLCPVGHFGIACEFKAAIVTIRIPRTAMFIPVLIAHFLHTPVTIPGSLTHRNTHFLKNVHPDTTITIRDDQQEFLSSIIIIQTFVDIASLYGSYYLLSLVDHNRTSLTKTLAFDHRCVHVSERLNLTVMNYTWIKRVKLYHHYFQDARCFFDETYMCLVDREQLIDCLNYNHEVARCTERNYCRHGGRCLESRKAGQLQFACVCPPCHYGLFYQLTMTQYALTLDSILGQEIIVDVPLGQQKPFLKITLALLVLMFVVGMISNICSTFTFLHVDIRSIGCGYYLLTLSIASQVSLIIFALRFLHLLVSQMFIISNRRFLSVSCTLFDYLLQVSVAFCDWLFVCVAVERTISVFKGIHFNKAISVRIVKFVVPTLLLGLLLAFVHQAFIRELIPDPHVDERLWCIVNISQAWLQTYDISMNLIHTIIPFMSNLISAVLLLINFSRMRQKVGRRSYIKVLKEQIKGHRYLLVSPILVIACKLPMLVLVLVIKCIHQRWQLYLSTACYLIALVPLTATFAIFVLPSPSYVKIFTNKRDRVLRRD